MLSWETLKPVQALAASLFFKHRRLLLCLPRQEGKTELGVRLLHEITRHPNTKSSLFLAKDHKSGKRATQEKFKRIFSEKEFAITTEKISLKKHPGSCIFTESVDKDPDRLRGGTFGMVHWAEIAFSKIEKGEGIISVMEKVVIPTTRKTNGYIFAETTLNGPNEFKTLWDNAKDYGFGKFRLGLSDLVYMGLASAEEYEQIQKTTHPDVFRQEYEVEFVTFAGKTYNEFEDRHVVEFPGPEEWQPVVAAIDWGFSPSATAVLFAYVKDGIMHIFDEHYSKHELPSTTANIVDLKKRQWNIQNLALVADHEEDRIEELRRRGLTCGKADKVNVMGARMQIKEALYFDKVKVHPRCTYLRKDWSAASWDPKKDGEIDYSLCTWGHFDMEAASRYLFRELSGLEIPRPERNPHMDGASAAAYDLNKDIQHDMSEL